MFGGCFAITARFECCCVYLLIVLLAMVFIWFMFAFGYCGDFDVWLLIVYIVCLLCLIACLFRFWFGLGPVFELFGCLGVVFAWFGFLVVCVWHGSWLAFGCWLLFVACWFGGFGLYAGFGWFVLIVVRCVGMFLMCFDFGGGIFSCMLLVWL